jgi:hypothetical protein
MGKLYCKIRKYGITTCAILIFGTSNAIVYSKSKPNVSPSAAELVPKKSCQSIICNLYQRIASAASANIAPQLRHRQINFQAAPPAPFVHLQPPSHEHLHTLRMNENHARLSPALVETCAGLSAGAISTLVVHPLDIIKTRLQSTPRPPSPFPSLLLPPLSLLQTPANLST